MALVRLQVYQGRWFCIVECCCEGHVGETCGRSVLSEKL